jgi:hypothetical protein
VADVLGLVQSDVVFRGRASVDAHVTGPLAAPLLRATAALTDASYAGTEVPNVGVELAYADRRAQARAVATALVPPPPDTVLGRRRYFGLAGPRRVRIVSGGPPVRRPVLEADAALPINLALQGVTGPRVDTTAAVNVDARLAALPLALASRFTDAVSDVGGTALGQVRVRGTLRRPDVAGDLRIADARVRLAATGALLRDLNAGIRLRGDTVVIDSLAGRAGPGTVRLSGGVGIRTPAAPAFDLRLAARDARLLDNEQGRINADAQISVYGPFNGVFVSGGARVLGGVLYIPESDNRQTLAADDPAVFAVIDTARLQDRAFLPTQSALLENLRVDLLAGVDRDTWVRSREANVEIHSDGDLRLRVDRARQALVLDGVVLTDRGDYTFLGKRFQIKRGAVTFVNTQELDPDLQLTAEYEVAQAGREPLNIQIQVGGSVSAPKVSLDSDAQPPIPQTELISYLAFGNSTGSLPVIGGSTLTSPTAGGSQVGAAANVATKRLAGVALGVMVDQAESNLGRSLGPTSSTSPPAASCRPSWPRSAGSRCSSRPRSSSSASTSTGSCSWGCRPRRRSTSSSPTCPASACSTASCAPPASASRRCRSRASSSSSPRSAPRRSSSSRRWACSSCGSGGSDALLAHASFARGALGGRRRGVGRHAAGPRQRRAVNQATSPTSGTRPSPSIPARSRSRRVATLPGHGRNAPSTNCPTTTRGSASSAAAAAAIRAIRSPGGSASAPTPLAICHSPT